MVKCPKCKAWQAFSGKECSFCRADMTDDWLEQAEELTEKWMQTLAPLDKVCVASHGALDELIAEALQKAYELGRTLGRESAK